PEWFKDAKFGIWAHWGPQCLAEDGDWYARFMYFAGTGQYNYHVANFGNPGTYGLKEMCRDWKEEKWDPEALVKLYHEAGARYFMTLGQHHDNFDLWQSPYQPWNSVNMGPKKDIVKGWSDACKKYGLPLGVSMHGSHAWTWLEGSQSYDGNLKKEDGTGKWWEGYDPQDLYAQNHRPAAHKSHRHIRHKQGW
ncbi:MAG: alpha-L-fucosidase, partial [Bacteroidaceae bacterium]|nr:alpha-L-fucosidase [Bacteroidaceae bacterium]